MRVTVAWVIALTIATAGCSESASERRAKFREDADRRASLVTDCRLLTVAWAAARDKRTRVQTEDQQRQARDEARRPEPLERADAEVDALVQRAGELTCPGIVP